MNNEQSLINKAWQVIDNYLTSIDEKNKRELKMLHMELTNLKTRDLLQNTTLLDAVAVLSTYLKEGKSQRKAVKALRDALSKLKRE